jgi:hypothetical protein
MSRFPLNACGRGLNARAGNLNPLWQHMVNSFLPGRGKAAACSSCDMGDMKHALRGPLFRACLYMQDMSADREGADKKRSANIKLLCMGGDEAGERRG